MGIKEESEKQTLETLVKVASIAVTQLAEYSQLGAKAIVKEWKNIFPLPERPTWEKWLASAVKEGYFDQDTAELIKPLYDMPPPWGAMAWFMVHVRMYVKLFFNRLDIFDLDQQYSNLAKATPHPAPVDALVRSMMIDPGRSKENRAELKKHGFSDTQIDNIVLANYRLYEENTIRECYLRGIIDNDTMYERMRELGFTDTRTKEIVQTWTLLPPPADLFTMVAHEAFEPLIYKELGLAEEFPVEQVEWLERQGISSEWAMKYWIAHWEQPSIGQGFEMLHRGVIDLKTLDLLFKAVEIPSFWRDKLTAIAYMPYTRVDTRRMHEMGVLDTKEVIEAYMAQGYDPAHAAKMAEFTLRYNADTEKQLTRSAVLESYREDLISRSDASDLLVAQDYSKDLADYYLTLEDFHKEKELQKIYISNLRDRYLLNIITAAEAKVALTKMGLRGSKIDGLMDAWQLDHYAYQQLPSKSDLDVFLIKGIIDDGQYYAQMARHGYTPQQIGWYVLDIKSEIKAGGKLPSKADIESFYKAKIINSSGFFDEMTQIGYSKKYITMYLQEIDPKWKEGVISTYRG